MKKVLLITALLYCQASNAWVFSVTNNTGIDLDHGRRTPSVEVELSGCSNMWTPYRLTATGPTKTYTEHSEKSCFPEKIWVKAFGKTFIIGQSNIALSDSDNLILTLLEFFDGKDYEDRSVKILRFSINGRYPQIGFPNN